MGPLFDHINMHMMFWPLRSIIVMLLKGGVQLLTAQKSINRARLWKGKFASFQMPQLRGGRTPVQRLTPSHPTPPDKEEVRAL